MSFRELNPQHELSGFYARIPNNPCQGRLRKFVGKKNGPFFVLELTEKCIINSIDKKTKNVKHCDGKPGQYIGVSAVKTLDALKADELLNKEIRLTFTGSTPSKNYPGKDIALFKIEVEDNS